MKRKRYTRKFQRMAVERMRSSDNIGDLAKPGSSFCQSLAERARAPWNFQRLIPKILRIALSERQHLSRGYRCLPPTVRSVGPKRFTRFGEERPIFGARHAGENLRPISIARRKP